MAVKLNPRLGPAIAVFRELGWAQAPIGTAPDLPLGTPEQRRIAVAGLASGQWSEFGELGNGRWGRISAIDVDETMLAIFAIRAGVDARRAVTIVPRVDDELIARIVGERGPAFAVRFIDGVCRASLRMWEHSCSFHGGAAVRLVADLRLEVPQNVDYLKDWVALALEQVAIELRDASDGRQPPRDPATAWRFMEHLAAAAALGVPATGPFGRLVPLAVSGGWIERDAAVALSFQALDSAQRPGDRRRWAEVLVDDLAVRDDEVVARAEELVPALASGEPGVVEWFAPILIRGVDEGQLAEVAMAALMVGTRKAQRIVIDALATRRAPRLDVIEVLAARLTELAGDKDRGLARATASLVRAWEVPAPEPVVEVVAPRGLWQPTPPVWQVPDFDPGPLTAEALTEAAAELLHGAQEAVGLAVERFLVIANAVARTDPDSARRALRGVRDEVWVSGLRPVPAWVGGHLPTRGLDATLTGRASAFPVLVAREYAVFQRLGAVPQLLSRPSSVDLQVRVADLVGRLGRYLAVGASAIEADFLLALARLDATGADAGMADSLSQLAVPVLRQDGVPLRSHAGQILRRYLADPLVDPGVVKRERDGAWWCADLVWPASLSEFPHRIRVGYGDPTFAEVPSWGDAAMTGVCWTGEVDRDLGVVARQLARRGRPLPPGASINLLAIQRSVHPAVAEDVAIAVVEAWQRGILRPGVADVRFLDWSGTPGSLAALAKALVETAGEGILSVVWPVVDDLIAASVAAPRLYAGTAELAESLARLLPEVVAAVEAGMAPATALDLPGLRALSGRSGSSQAVRVARETVARLPEPTVRVEALPGAARGSAITLSDNDFHAAWSGSAGSAPPVPDGVRVDLDWVDAKAPTRVLRFDLELPEGPGARFRVVKQGWVYDLEREGQCSAVSLDGGSPASAKAVAREAWLHWDAESGRLVAAAYRNWRKGVDGPLSGARTPLSDSLVAVGLGTVTQDGDAGRAGARLVTHLAQEELIGWAGVRSAMRALLLNESFSPARLAALVESRPRLLPVLWPVLAEPIRVAGSAAGMPPRWLNRVLDGALQLAPLLAGASRHGRLPGDATSWPGLGELAARKGPAGVVTKAGRLSEALELR